MYIGISGSQLRKIPDIRSSFGSNKKRIGKLGHEIMDFDNDAFGSPKTETQYRLFQLIY